MSFELANLRKRVEALEARQERVEAFLRKLEQRAFPALVAKRCETCHGIASVGCVACNGSGLVLVEAPCA